MSFFDEIKKAQLSAVPKIEKKKSLSEMYGKEINTIAQEIKSGLLEKAKTVPPSIPFAYDGFIRCFFCLNSDWAKMRLYDVFHADNFISAFGPITISVGALGNELLSCLNSVLSKDKIRIVSLCCEGQNDECAELPMSITYSLKGSRAVWKVRAKNVRLKTESDSFDTSINDKIRYGVHCVYDSRL